MYYGADFFVLPGCQSKNSQKPTSLVHLCCKVTILTFQNFYLVACGDAQVVASERCNFARLRWRMIINVQYILTLQILTFENFCVACPKKKDTCAGAAPFLKGLVKACPANPRTALRSPATCGKDSCLQMVRSIDDAAISDTKTGISACYDTRSLKNTHTHTQTHSHTHTYTHTHTHTNTHTHTHTHRALRERAYTLASALLQ